MPTNKIVIDGDPNPYKRAAKEVEASIHHLRETGNDSAKELIAGAIGLEVIKETVVKTFEWAESLQQVAEQTGETKENLAAMQRMAERVGGSMETVQKMFDKTTEAFKKATEDQSEMHKLNLLGITREMVMYGKVREALEAVARAQKNKSASASNVAFSDILGGRGLAAKATAMRDNLSNFDNFKKKGQEQGTLPKDADLDTLVIAQREMVQLMNEAKTAMVPALARTLEFFLDLWYDIGDFIELHAAGLFTFIQNVDIFKLIGDSIKSIGDVLLDQIKAVYEDLKHGNIKSALLHAMQIGPLGTGAKALEAGVNKQAEAVELAKQAEADTEEDQKKRREQRLEARAEAKKELHTSEGFTTPLKPESKVLTIPSDSLVSVGNFLGSDMGSVVSLQRSQLDATRETNEHLSNLVAAVNNLQTDNVIGYTG